jgi:serine/threonine protein kinase
MSFVEAEEFGPYMVYEQLGLGGMATVHRAETQGIAGFSKQVALKRMLPNVASNASLVKSFIREAQLASHLRHANVAQTYDLGKVGDTYFIAMELVPGHNLREILKHCAAVVGHMPMPIAMHIVNQICDALDYAHNLCDEMGRPLGIIHRDVSPSNIIVSEGGVVKLIDFGIAKATASTGGMNTMSGTIKGKFGYMAPEYLMGSIDARADLFALGVIAHELLSNRPLFQGKDDMDTLYRVKDMPILPPSRVNPKVPPEIDSIIMTALERDPDQRWQRATALREALTTETKRLGLATHNSAVVEWIEWAFNQTSNKSPFDVQSEPMISLGGGTAELPRGSAAAILARPSAPVLADDGGDDDSDMDGQETILKPEGKAYDWNAMTDMTTPAGGALDEAIASTRSDPTKLVRKSAQHVSASPDPDLIDTSRNRSSKPNLSAPHQTETLRDHPGKPAAPRQTETLREKPAAPRQTETLRDKPAAPRQTATLRDKPSSPHIVQRRDTPVARSTPIAWTAAPRPTPAARPTPTPRPTPSPTPEPAVPDIETTVRDAKDPVSVTDDDVPQTVPARPSRPSDLRVPRSDARAQTMLDSSAAEPASARVAQPAAIVAAPPQQPMAGLAVGPSPHARTLPGQGTPASAPPHAPAPRRVAVVSVDAEQARYARAALDDLAARAERPSAREVLNGVEPHRAQASAVRTRVEMIKRSRASNFLLAVLVLIAAGGAAAVVYFALPYLT